MHLILLFGSRAFWFLYFIIGISSINTVCMWLILRSVSSQTTKTRLQDQGLDLFSVILVRYDLGSEQLSHISECFRRKPKGLPEPEHISVLCSFQSLPTSSIKAMCISSTEMGDKKHKRMISDITKCYQAMSLFSVVITCYACWKKLRRRMVTRGQINCNSVNRVSTQQQQTLITAPSFTINNEERIIYLQNGKLD